MQRCLHKLMRIKRRAQADVLVIGAHVEMESRFIAKISDVNIICITLKEVFIKHREYCTCLSRHVSSHEELLFSCKDVAAVPLSALWINMRGLLLRQSANRLLRSSHYVIRDAQYSASVNTHGLLNLGVSATNPVSLNPLINCRTALRCDSQILETFPQTYLMSSVYSCP
jgi:hypothetical protein